MEQLMTSNQQKQITRFVEDGVESKKIPKVAYIS